MCPGSAPMADFIPEEDEIKVLSPDNKSKIKKKNINDNKNRWFSFDWFN